MIILLSFKLNNLDKVYIEIKNKNYFKILMQITHLPQNNPRTIAYTGNKRKGSAPTQSNDKSPYANSKVTTQNIHL